MIPRPGQFPSVAFGKVDFHLGALEPPQWSVGHSGLLAGVLVLNITESDPALAISDLSFCSNKHVFASFEEEGQAYRARGLWRALNKLERPPLSFMLVGTDFAFHHDFTTGRGRKFAAAGLQETKS